VCRSNAFRTANPSVTDTELQTARFVVPIEALDPDIDVTGGRITGDVEVPASWRYSPRFYGHGIRGHKFHVRRS
jgi:hypothetical protein